MLPKSDEHIRKDFKFHFVTPVYPYMPYFYLAVLTSRIMLGEDEGHEGWGVEKDVYSILGWVWDVVLCPSLENVLWNAVDL